CPRPVPGCSRPGTAARRSPPARPARSGTRSPGSGTSWPTWPGSRASRASARDLTARRTWRRAPAGPRLGCGRLASAGPGWPHRSCSTRRWPGSMEIIDSHCHAGHGDGLTGPWDTSAPLGAYLRRARAAGITRTILFPAFHSNYTVANREVAGIVASLPGRFYGYAMVNPARDAGRVHQMVGHAVREWGFCGIKVHRHDGRISREVCETARRFSVPVLYDVMGEASVVELLAT